MIAQATKVAARLLQLDLQLSPDGESRDDFKIRLTDVPYPRGFVVLASRGYLNWRVSIRPDPESRPFLAKMRAAALGSNADAFL